ncbi:FAD-dependent oxidoreductase [Methylocystis sp. 9N]|uniref:FAD-dependent oxidoreductase n=1 Tax=Methylocystis borbori TaxID=3118750 RepID=A0ABU7XL58_9HYPH
MRTTDVVVLGAGVVGVSAALHLQARGRAVALVDRHRAAGQETSFGNAGLIERSSLIPYLFPRNPAKLIKYALNLLPESHYHLAALPAVGPWLMRYWRESAPDRVHHNIEARRPLIENSLKEHEALIEQAGAQHLLRKNGWIKLYRSERTLEAGAADADRLRAFGLHIDTLDSRALAALEPDFAPLAGGVHLRDTASVVDPGALSKAYADLFVSRGGLLLAGDARSLAPEQGGRWRVAAEGGPIVAREAVVALGPWSDAIFGPLGYHIPLGWKRGYHMHYAAKPGARLNHVILDVDVGYLLAPMTRGIRLTSGAEFARRDAPPSPVQIELCEPAARALFPLGERLDPEPWRGARPCLPDMLPIVGPAPRHKGLWFDFGHAHHGLTLGPVTGRLIAEMMTGETPFIDPTPYSAARF